MKKGIFFDLDGTLINTLDDICGILNLTREFYGLKPLPFTQIKGAIGRGAENLVKQCFAELNSFSTLEIVSKYNELYHGKISMGGKIYEGVLPTLESFRSAGWTIGIATNKPRLIARKTLEHYVPNTKFDVLMGPEDVSAKKPSPKHLLETLAQAGVEPENAWFVGDDPVDLACADGAKVRFLGAGWGFGGVCPGKERLIFHFTEILEKIGPL